MSSRLEMIKRLAVTDAYWAAYLDGMNDAHHVGEVAAQSADFAEHARLIEARLDRNSRRASFMSDRLSMDEARVKASIERSAAAQAVLDNAPREDYDQEWTPVRGIAIRETDETRRMRAIGKSTGVVRGVFDRPIPNSADLGAPRVP